MEKHWHIFAICTVHYVNHFILQERQRFLTGPDDRFRFGRKRAPDPSKVLFSFLVVQRGHSPFFDCPFGFRCVIGLRRDAIIVGPVVEDTLARLMNNLNAIAYGTVVVVGGGDSFPLTKLESQEDWPTSPSGSWTSTLKILTSDAYQ